MGELTQVALVTLLLLTITHGQLGQFVDGQEIAQEDVTTTSTSSTATTTGKAYLVNGNPVSNSFP